MVMANRFEDNRLAARFSAHLPVIIRRKTDTASPNAPAYDASCIDISSAGIRLGSAELFQLHERLELTIFSPDGGPSITCDAQVVRLARTGGHYEIAARIVEVPAFAEPASAAR